MNALTLKKIIVFVLGLNVIVLDVVLAYMVFSGNSLLDITPKQIIPTVVDTQNSSGETKPVEDYCGESCRNYMDERLKVATATADVVKPTPITSSKTTTTTQTKTKSTSYLPISGSGSVNSTSWTDIAGTEFYLAKVDYPGLIGAYLEVNLKLQNGNGMAYIRLYDVSHLRAVDGSDVSTSSQTATVVTSGAISLWEGNNLYRIQARSLTADTTVYGSGRVKLITEN